MLERLNEAEKRFEAIEADLANPEIMSDIEKYTALMKDRANLAPIIEKFREYKKA
ncbi:MAG: PCRF domain-containing protein, partial [Clostridia bacterium]|nr:PCRF domain-containing protein [Clostridia bacterium]